MDSSRLLAAFPVAERGGQGLGTRNSGFARHWLYDLGKFLPLNNIWWTGRVLGFGTSELFDSTTF